MSNFTEGPDVARRPYTMDELAEMVRAHEVMPVTRLFLSHKTDARKFFDALGIQERPGLNKFVGLPVETDRMLPIDTLKVEETGRRPYYIYLTDAGEVRGSNRVPLRFAPFATQQEGQQQMSDTTRAVGQTAEERAAAIVEEYRGGLPAGAFRGATRLKDLIATEILTAEQRGRDSIFQEAQVPLLELAEGLWNEARLGAQGIFMANLTKAVMQAEQLGREEATAARVADELKPVVRGLIEAHDIAQQEERQARSSEESEDFKHGRIYSTGRIVRRIFSRAYELDKEAEPSPAAPPCPWADLAGLSGRARRERIRSRVTIWRSAASRLEELRDIYCGEPVSKADMQTLIDHIYDLELPLTQEAERLWAEEQEKNASA